MGDIMEKNSALIRNILFNILVVLTIILIYFLFFPKKSYVESKLNEELNPIKEETFNQNIKSMEIAASNYFNENNDESKVTIQQLIEKNLLVDLKDSANNICDKEKSYIENKEDKLIIYLSCSDKEGTKEIVKENEANKNNQTTNDGKILCLYEYRKQLPDSYTNWSDFSEWSTEEKATNELMNVETKVEKIIEGTKIITETKEISIEATKKKRQSCPNGYTLSGEKCKKEEKTNSITAAISYTCPTGYSKNGTTCYKNGNTINATKKYYCPSNRESIRFELSENKCNVINITYLNTTIDEEYFTCPSGYRLSGTKCYTTKTIEKEVDNYKEVTYYRYQTREKNKTKYDIKWGSINDNILLEDEYIMSRKIFCEF